ncbi:MAG: DUF1835 domain-containing protein [Bacteroidetes bacterium]|nr:DUF1835 domain-containing protein [Bacteroidota bacterium]
MLQLVFNEPDIETLKQSIELDNSLSGEILLLRDDYAVGPLQDIYTEAGASVRKEWWTSVLEGGDYEHVTEKNTVNDLAIVNSIIEQLNSDADSVLWIWMAQNKHDVCGYYWLMSQLKAYQGRIYVVFLNNLPFINEKGQLFYPEWISQILPKELLKAKRLARTITPSEFEVDPDEWSKICQDDKTVRILEGGKKLSLHPESFYDNELKKFITDEWQKAGKIIHQFQQKSKHSTGDAFLLWRLKYLLQSDMYDIQGSVKNMKDFEVKKKSGVLFEE